MSEPSQQQSTSSHLDRWEDDQEQGIAPKASPFSRATTQEPTPYQDRDAPEKLHSSRGSSSEGKRKADLIEDEDEGFVGFGRSFAQKTPDEESSQDPAEDSDGTADSTEEAPVSYLAYSDHPVVYVYSSSVLTAYSSQGENWFGER